MLGAGVFVVFAPAARLAGGWLPVAIVLAGLVAAFAAFADADLAARYPGPGAGYRYGRETLAPCVGRLAGVAALVGRVAAAAAAALVFGDYVQPGHPVWVAVPLIAVVGGLNVAGVRWTVRGAWVLVPGVLVVLAVVVVAGLTRHVPADWSVPGIAGNGIGDVVASGQPAGGLPMPADDAVRAAYPVTPLGVLSAAGLVFFAFAGFAAGYDGTPAGTDATPGRRGRVIPVMLLIVLVSYLAVAAALMHALDVPRLAMESAPLVAGVGGTDAPALGVLVRVGAAAATACALFGVLAGAGRTAVAMAERRDLPRWLGPAGLRGTPWRASLVGVAGAVLIVVLASPAQAVALCACCALIYYAVVNLAALRLPSAQRRWPRWTSVLGLPLCLGLALLLPRTQVLITVALLLVGCVGGWLVARRAARVHERHPLAPPERPPIAAPEQSSAVPPERPHAVPPEQSPAREPESGLTGGPPPRLAADGAAGMVPDGGNGC